MFLAFLYKREITQRNQDTMLDQDEPLGCFQKLSYGLVGVGIYFLVSVCCLISGALIVLQVSPTPNPRQDYDILGGALVAVVIPAISFLCIGPLMVVAYVLYLQDIRVINVRDPVPAPSIKQQEKRKKSV